MSDSEFSVIQIIRDVLREIDSPIPDRIAKEVTARVRPDQLQDAFDQMILHYVRHVLSQERVELRRNYNQASIRAAATPDTGNSPDPGQPIEVRSARLRIRDLQWEEMLDTYPVYLGPGNSNWKYLRDCTPEDLERNAEVLEHTARRTMTRAAAIRGFAGFLREHRLGTVGDIPESLQSAAFAAFNSTTASVVSR